MQRGLVSDQAADHRLLALAAGQAMLAGIERAGLFVVPLDEVRGWWRYHHLFAGLLRARLQAEQPGRVQALHRAAAAAGYNRQALAHLGEDDWLMRSFVRWNRAVTDWLDGRLGPAERRLAEVLADRRAAGALFAGFLPMRVCYDLGEVQRARGNLDAARATYRQALDTFGESSQIALTGPAHVAWPRSCTSGTT